METTVKSGDLLKESTDLLFTNQQVDMSDWIQQSEVVRPTEQGTFTTDSSTNHIEIVIPQKASFLRDATIVAKIERVDINGNVIKQDSTIVDTAQNLPSAAWLLDRCHVRFGRAGPKIGGITNHAYKWLQSKLEQRKDAKEYGVYKEHTVYNKRSALITDNATDVVGEAGFIDAINREKLKFEGQKLRRFARLGGSTLTDAEGLNRYVVVKLSDIIKFHKDFPLMLASNGLSIELELRTDADILDTKALNLGNAVTDCKFKLSDVQCYTHEIIPPESLSKSIIESAATKEMKLSFTSYEGQRFDINGQNQTFQINSQSNRVQDTVVQFVDISDGVASYDPPYDTEASSRSLILPVKSKSKYLLSHLPPLNRLQLEVNGVYYNGSTWSQDPEKYLHYMYTEYKMKTGADVEFEEWLYRQNEIIFDFRSSYDMFKKTGLSTMEGEEVRGSLIQLSIDYKVKPAQGSQKLYVFHETPNMLVFHKDRQQISVMN